MQIKGNDPMWAQNALDVIRRVDPSTYDRMMECDWRLYVTDGADDLFWVIASEPFEFVSLASDLPVAFGVTPMQAQDGDGYAALPDDLVGTSFLNRPGINQRAKELGVPTADFLADVMVHEFKHRDGWHDEPDAFAAGTAFARTLEGGDGPIAQLSEATLADYGDFES